MSESTVIIVEDQADIAEMFAEMMRVSGFRALTSFTSAKALDLIATEKPALVILDVMMPDVSGLDVLRFMMHDPQLASIPVVIVSAMSLSSDIKSGIAAGASAYLTKPVDFTELKEIVKKLTAAGASA
ncbi:MAG: response regulator [Chloroflexi bacterium]|nr:response regulator [Chloroflexota bacterium]